MDRLIFGSSLVLVYGNVDNINNVMNCANIDIHHFFMINGFNSSASGITPIVSFTSHNIFETLSCVYSVQKCLASNDTDFYK